MKNQTVSIFIILILVSSVLFSQNQDSLKIIQLEKRVQKLEKKIEENELEKIINAAQTKANEQKEIKKEKVFKSGQRSLQAINPEISVIGDLFGQYIANRNSFTQDLRSGAYFRTVGFHIQGGLDPFSFTKAVIEVHPDGVELGEAYITWTKFIKNISLTAGKFRQQFGVVNRWHVHAADQLDFPLAMKTILGEDGLNQIGISFDWTLPSLVADANQLILQVTNGQNEQLFSGEKFSFPSVLAHLKNYWDLSRNTYLELGLTGMIGKNNISGYDEAGNLLIENSRMTVLSGIDLSMIWEPVNRALYKSLTWRSELYYADKELYSGKIKAWGGYSYLEYKFDEQWQFGARFDYTQPFEQNNSSIYSYQIVPYITWEESHWVKLRLQYNYLKEDLNPDAQNIFRLQIVFAVGPHKHDRY